MKKCFVTSLILHFVFLVGVLIGFVQTIISNGDNYVLFVLMVIPYCFSYVFMFTFFSMYTNMFPKNKLDKNIIMESDLKCNFDIIVTNQNDVFNLEINGRQYTIDLTGYIFKKEYIIALLIRNFRYYSISNKKPLKYLFSHKIIVSKLNTNLNCNILFYAKRNLKKNVQIIKKSFSTINFLQNQINKAKYYRFFYTNWSKSQYINKHICKINEKIYQQGELIS